MLKIAKQKDTGECAYLGMLCQCASYFDIDIHSECAKYIVDTYLECINHCTFFEWIRSQNVTVMNEEYLKENFNDLLSYSNDLEVLQDLFMYLYDQEIWIDKYEKVLYSTVFTLSLKNRTRLNYIGIAMEFERLLTLKEKEIVNWKDMNEFVECLYLYGYDIDKDYDYRTENIDTTIDNIIERINQIFHLTE
jgi:hypothetical protein